MAREFSLVVAVSINKGIGKDGKLPWEIPEELKHFKQVTLSGNTENTVIMGRKTWESIPSKFRPLAKRKNIVVSSTLISSNCVVVSSLLQAFEQATGLVFLIGGFQIFEESLSSNWIRHCKQIYLTRIAKPFESDTFFPSSASSIFDDSFLEDFNIASVSKTSVYKGIPYDYVLYTNKLYSSFESLIDYPLHEEYQYLSLVREIINKGGLRDDRTKVGTFSVFGRMSRYDLSQSFPVFTTKLVFWRGVVEELLWFIKGSTNSNELKNKNIHFWDANGSREFLDSLGFNSREEGDLGPVYGFQWRHFGADYVDMHADYTGQGVDQLQEIIKLLKTDPCSRRIILSAWNPKAQPLMALPPCHVISQFYVENGKLSCLMFQRSGDMGLGVPFNISSYSLLTCLLAQVCGLQRGEFVHIIGDTHVYSNHVESLLIQIQRHPFPFPLLELNPEVTNIEAFEAQDIQLKYYNKHAKIVMEMAV